MIDKDGIRAELEDIFRNGGTMKDITDAAIMFIVLDGMKKYRIGEDSSEGMSRQLAEEWVSGMKNVDQNTPTGGKWSPDQIRTLLQKRGETMDDEKFWAFYAVMNAMYSDYYEVAKRYNAVQPEFFADMAKAFLDDKDAVPDKSARYYECIVEH